MTEGVGTAGGALASAARDRAVGASFGSTTLGLANAKLDRQRAQKNATRKN
jgi:type IV secretion system protein TrbL